MTFLARALFGLLALLGMLTTPASAQSNPSLTAYERGVDEGEGDSKEESARLRIVSMRIDARVHGRMADVTLEMEIATTSKVADEVRLALNMPADAVVTGYALDVGGRMIAGELLDQPKARNVYEDEVRKGIDPGLAEVTEQNQFRTRIFPLTADNPRRFRMSFSAPFDPAKGIVLPLASAAPVGALSVTLRAEGYATPPEVQLGGRKLALTKQGSAWVAERKDSAAALTGELAISGGELRDALQISRHANGQHFFQIDDSGTGAKLALQQGGRLRVYWDRSLSRRDDLLDKEADLLDALVAGMRASGIDLVTFASDRPVVSALANAAALKSALGAVTYRGGTSFAGLDDLALPDADLCLLFGDGIATIDHAAEFAPGCRLSVVSSAPDANGARLGRIAQASRGEFMRLTADNGAALVQRLLRPSVAVVSARDQSGRRLGFRSLPAPDGSWRLVGEMPESGPVVLRIAGLRQGLTQRTYGENAGAPIQLDAPGALWAAQRLGELNDNPDARDRMVAMSRRFRVAGPTMSFLVLESPEQYLSADITPPEGFSKEWMEEYRTARAERGQSKSAARAERLAFVLEQWKERKAWWNKRFITRPRPKPRTESRFDRAVASADASASPRAQPNLAVPPPPPPPPPSPARAAEPRSRADQEESFSGGEDDASQIVVTSQRRQSNAQDVPVAVTAVSDTLLARDADGTRIELKVGDVLSNQPYIAALTAASAPDRMKVLAAEELKFGSLPAFYLDTADWFRAKGDMATAQLLLFSALELPGTDDETRQIIAFRLERDGAFDRSVAMNERFAAGASFRPQPKRALALSLAARGLQRGGSGRADLERAFRLLSEVALEPAIDDFQGIELVALMEANALIPAIEAAGGTWELDPRLVAKLDTDVRIVIEWTADDADIDLWVDEPNGERVYYGTKLSSSGGQISNDMTDGYGPEEYAIRRAPTGEYQVRVNGFDADRINPNGPGHVLIRLIRDFARPGVKQTLVDADLSFQKGRNRDEEDGARPLATLKVERR